MGPRHSLRFNARKRNVTIRGARNTVVRLGSLTLSLLPVVIAEPIRGQPRDREGERLRLSRRKGRITRAQSRDGRGAMGWRREAGTANPRTRMFHTPRVVSGCFPALLAMIMRAASLNTARPAGKLSARLSGLIAHGAPTACHLILRDCTVGSFVIAR